MTEVLEVIQLTALPALKQPLEGGLFVGVITMPDGKPYAVTWLNEAKPPQRLGKDAAVEWAKSIGAQLVTRAIVSLMVATAGDLLPDDWTWTIEDYANDSSCAWGCDLSHGGVGISGRSARGAALAVRLIPLVH